MTSTTDGTMMAATVVAGHIKHEDDKHSRRTPRLRSISIFPVYEHTTLLITELQGQPRSTPLHENVELASNRPKLRISPLI